jgi:hypothetical protein
MRFAAAANAPRPQTTSYFFDAERTLIVRKEGMAAVIEFSIPGEDAGKTARSNSLEALKPSECVLQFPEDW